MASLVCVPRDLDTRGKSAHLGVKDVLGECECDVAVEVVSQVLKGLCGEDGRSGNEGNEWLQAFTSEMKPTFSLRSFISYLVRRLECTPSALVVSLVYLDRLLERSPSIILSMFTIHRLFLTALLLACKFLDDRAYGNRFFAHIVGCTYEEMNELELCMLEKLNFRLFVNEETFKRYATFIV